METRTTYITNDGKKFDDEAAALQHERIEPVVAAYLASLNGISGRTASRRANDIRAFLVWQAAQQVAA